MLKKTVPTIFCFDQSFFPVFSATIFALPSEFRLYLLTSKKSTGKLEQNQKQQHSNPEVQKTV
jgi:hypothetical protein